MKAKTLGEKLREETEQTAAKNYLNYLAKLEEQMHAAAKDCFSSTAVEAEFLGDEVTEKIKRHFEAKGVSVTRARVVVLGNPHIKLIFKW